MKVLSTWQICPRCDGAGVINIECGPVNTKECPICKGQKIISKETGLPPLVRVSGDLNCTPQPATLKTTAHQDNNSAKITFTQEDEIGEISFQKRTYESVEWDRKNQIVKFEGKSADRNYYVYEWLRKFLNSDITH